VTRVDGQAVAVLDDASDRVDLRQVDPRVDALRVEVQRQRDQIDVAGALAVAEQRALDAIGSCRHRQLGGGDRGAAIVVRVDAQHERVAPRGVAVEPLDPVGVDIRHRHLDRRGEVQDHFSLGRGLPDVHDRGADVDREVELGTP